MWLHSFRERATYLQIQSAQLLNSKNFWLREVWVLCFVLFLKCHCSFMFAFRIHWPWNVAWLGLQTLGFYRQQKTFCLLWSRESYYFCEIPMVLGVVVIDHPQLHQRSAFLHAEGDSPADWSWMSAQLISKWPREKRKSLEMLSNAVVGVETPRGVTLTASVFMMVELVWSVMGLGLSVSLFTVTLL